MIVWLAPYLVTTLFRLPVALPVERPWLEWDGRLVRGAVHVGIRPALDLGNGIGATLQVSS